MTRRTLLTGVTGALQGTPAVERPNLLFILTDQQTHDAMSCAGNRWPALDSLAADGTRFTECYTTYPLCSPARSSIFSGRMPHETGVRLNDLAIRTGIPTMGEIFAAAGYETVYAGKWHLPKTFEEMTGFRRLIGGSHLGAEMDAPAASACIDFMRRRKSAQPFLMVASLMNPHDIGEWIRQHRGRRQHPDPDRYPPAPPTMGARGGTRVHALAPDARLRDGFPGMPYRVGVARNPSSGSSSTLTTGWSSRWTFKLAASSAPCATPDSTATPSPDPQGRMLRTSRYKYCVFNAGANPEQLFDLELDPGEVRNLAGIPEHRDALHRHRVLLAGWIRETADDFKASELS